MPNPYEKLPANVQQSLGDLDNLQDSINELKIRPPDDAPKRYTEAAAAIGQAVVTLDKLNQSNKAVDAVNLAETDHRRLVSDLRATPLNERIDAIQNAIKTSDEYSESLTTSLDALGLKEETRDKIVKSYAQNREITLTKLLGEANKDVNNKLKDEVTALADRAKIWAFNNPGQPITSNPVLTQGLPKILAISSHSPELTAFTVNQLNASTVTGSIEGLAQFKRFSAGRKRLLENKDLLDAKNYQRLYKLTAQPDDKLDIVSYAFKGDPKNEEIVIASGVQKGLYNQNDIKLLKANQEFTKRIGGGESIPYSDIDAAVERAYPNAPPKQKLALANLMFNRTKYKEQLRVSNVGLFQQNHELPQTAATDEQRKTFDDNVLNMWKTRAESQKQWQAYIGGYAHADKKKINLSLLLNRPVDATSNFNSFMAIMYASDLNGANIPADLLTDMQANQADVKRAHSAAKFLLDYSSEAAGVDTRAWAANKFRSKEHYFAALATTVALEKIKEEQSTSNIASPDPAQRREEILNGTRALAERLQRQYEDSLVDSGKVTPAPGFGDAFRRGLDIIDRSSTSAGDRTRGVNPQTGEPNSNSGALRVINWLYDKVKQGIKAIGPTEAGAGEWLTGKNLGDTYIHEGGSTITLVDELNAELRNFLGTPYMLNKAETINKIESGVPFTKIAEDSVAAKENEQWMWNPPLYKKFLSATSKLPLDDMPQDELVSTLSLQMSISDDKAAGIDTYNVTGQAGGKELAANMLYGMVQLESLKYNDQLGRYETMQEVSQLNRKAIDEVGGVGITQVNPKIWLGTKNMPPAQAAKILRAYEENPALNMAHGNTIMKEISNRVSKSIRNKGGKWYGWRKGLTNGDIYMITMGQYNGGLALFNTSSRDFANAYFSEKSELFVSHDQSTKNTTQNLRHVLRTAAMMAKDLDTDVRFNRLYNKKITLRDGTKTTVAKLVGPKSKFNGYLGRLNGYADFWNAPYAKKASPNR